MSKDTTSQVKRDAAKAGNTPTPREQLGITNQEFDAMGQLGTMYYHQGDLERARIVFEGMVEVDPSSSSAHAALGALLVRCGEDDRAVIHLDRAIELDDKQLSSYVNRAEVHLKRKLVEKAVVDLKRAIALDPSEQDPAANRARVMVLGLSQALKAKGIIN